MREHESPEEIASVALDFGRLLMEAGASAHAVENITTRVATALGASHIDLRVGYASLSITIRIANESMTRICKVGALGVNQRLGDSLFAAASRIEQTHSAAEARQELERLLSETPRHSDWVLALGVGIACAGFGRLLDVDWIALGPIFVASALAQLVRRQLARGNINSFISTAAVAFVGSTLCGLGARWLGSGTVARDMIVAVLLLVPGVPAFNSQFDILEGRPTLGSARAVWVAATLLFMTAGVWLAQGLLGEGR